MDSDPEVYVQNATRPSQNILLVEEESERQGRNRRKRALLISPPRPGQRNKSPAKLSQVSSLSSTQQRRMQIIHL
jgi:hypothetical protein